MSKNDLIFAMTGARGLCGGIASANLNVLQAIGELSVERKRAVTVYSLLEKDTDRPNFLPSPVIFKAFHGNKISFALHLLQESIHRPVFCFDHVRMALPLLPLAVAGQAKTIIFAHGSESWKRMHKTSRWCFASASLCLTNSYFTLQKMHEHIPKFKGEACPLGLSPEFALNTEVPPTANGLLRLIAEDGEAKSLKDQVLLLVARMDQSEGEKGHRALIHVLPELLNEFPGVQLVFAGPGDDCNNLRKLAQTKRVAASVFFTGFVSQENLEQLYKCCYAFVMPSKQEGFGLAYLEAMNYGKPCIGCFNQGADDVIIYGETGFLIQDPDNLPELLQILRKLLLDRQLASELGKNGLDRLNKNFTARHYQERIKQKVLGLL